MGRNVSQLRALEAINLGTQSPSMHEGTHFGQKADFFAKNCPWGEWLYEYPIAKHNSSHWHSTAWSGTAVHVARSIPWHSFTHQICQSLRSDIPPSEAESPRQMWDHIFKKDWDLLLMKAEHHPTLELTLRVARNGSWLKVWDHALDHGPIGTKHLTAIFRVMTQPTFGTRPCLVNGCEIVPENHTVWACTERPYVSLPKSIQNVSSDDVTTLLMDRIDMTILLELGSSCYKLLYPSVFLDHAL